MLVGAGVNPFVMLFVGFITLLAALVSESPSQSTAATQPLALINMLAVLGSLVAVPGGGILFAIVFSILLIYVALLVQDLIFALSNDKEQSTGRYV